MPDDARSATFVVLALCVYTCILFAPNLFFEFTYDDFIFFHPAEHGEDVRLKDQALADPSLLLDDGRWMGRSLRALTLAFDYAIWGTNPTGYHLTNIIIHIAVVVTIFIFLRDAFGSNALAGLAALFFAVHPIHTEVVANVSYRKDSLACLVGLWCLFFSRRKAKPWFWVLSLVLLGVTFLSKEVVGLCTFAALVATDVFLREEGSTTRRNWWPIATYYSILLALSATYILTSYAGKEWWIYLRGFSETSSSLTLGDVVTRSICAFGYNLRLLYVPWGYAPEHYPPWGFTISGSAHLSEPLAHVDLYLGLLHIVLLPVLAVRLRRFKTASWGIAFFVSSYFALTGAIVFMHRLFAERYLYMPSLGFCVVLGYIVWKLRHSRRGFFLCLIGITVTFSVSTVVHSLSWRDDYHLWKPLATSSGPRHPDVVLNFTHACGLTGRHEEGAEAATRYLTQTRGRLVKNPVFYKNLAGNLRGAGELDKSTALLEAVLRYFPDDAGLQFSLGLNVEEYARRGDRKRSGELASKILGLGESVEALVRCRAHCRLGLNARDEGDFHAAKDHLTRAVQLHPTAEAHVWLAQVHFALGRLKDAQENAQRALHLDGQNSAARELLRRLADRKG